MPWIVANPLSASAAPGRLGRVLETVAVDRRPRRGRGLYLRQMDVEGVDTKFVERHHGCSTTSSRRSCQPNGSTDRRRGLRPRFGFLEKPGYTRFRCSTPELGFPPVHRDDASGPRSWPTRARGRHGFVVENEVTYLAFPRSRRDRRVRLGLRLTGLAVCRGCPTRSRLLGRHRHPRLRHPRPAASRSDRSARSSWTRHLLAHAQQWVTEPNPTNRVLQRLTSDEASLYRALVEGQYGSSFALEQERVRFSLLHQSLSALDVEDASPTSPGGSAARSTAHWDPPDPTSALEVVSAVLGDAGHAITADVWPAGCR